MSPLWRSGQDDWPGAIARDWRLQKGWKLLQSGLFPVPTPDEHIIKHRLRLSSELKKEKKTVVESHAWPRKCLRKVQKAMLFAWSNGRDARTSCPGRNNTIGLFHDEGDRIGVSTYRRRSGQSVTASDFGSNGPRFESGRGRCVESLDKALYSHCPKEKPSH